MRSKALIAALSVAAVIAIGCGAADPEVETGSGAQPGNAAKAESADRKPVTAVMGEPIKVSANEMTASYTVSKPKIKKSGQYGIEPQNGAWLLVFYRVDVAKGEALTCACDLSLVDKTGKVHEWSTGGVDKQYPDFSATSVKAGQHADGWVVFDLPQSAINGAKVQLKVMSLFGDNAYGYWTVKA